MMNNLKQKYIEINQQIKSICDKLAVYSKDFAECSTVCDKCIKFVENGGEIYEYDIEICEAELKDLTQLFESYKEKIKL